MWRNWIARQTSNLKVAGSNPVMDKYIILFLNLYRFPSGQRGQTQVLMHICFAGSNPVLYKSRHSSVGRARDCSSPGHWFESGCRDASLV